jgi:hypothetical protein
LVRPLGPFGIFMRNLTFKLDVVDPISLDWLLQMIKVLRLIVPLIFIPVCFIIVEINRGDLGWKLRAWSFFEWFFVWFVLTLALDFWVLVHSPAKKGQIKFLNLIFSSQKQFLRCVVERIHTGAVDLIFILHERYSR